MERQEKNIGDYYTIDVLYIVKSLWRHAWLIAACGLLSAVIGFLISAYAIDPTYSSYVKLYVNNSSASLGGTSSGISSSELTAAKSLVRTYGDILDSRSTLERVIEHAGVDYTWQELSEMIKYSSPNDTEILLVTVTCEDPNEASKIANTIAEVLPLRISEIIGGASMKVVDYAIPDAEKVAPSIMRYTAIGLVFGVLISIIALVIVALSDGTVHDEEYILRTYDYPILGNVPDLLNTGNKTYGSHSRKHPKTSI